MRGRFFQVSWAFISHIMIVRKFWVPSFFQMSRFSNIMIFWITSKIKKRSCIEYTELLEIKVTLIIPGTITTVTVIWFWWSLIRFGLVFDMILNVVTNLGPNVGTYMTRNVRINMKMNVPPRLPMCGRKLRMSRFSRKTWKFRISMYHRTFQCSVFSRCHAFPELLGTPEICESPAFPG